MDGGADMMHLALSALSVDFADGLHDCQCLQCDNHC
jgi:hypothetical protein